MKSTANVMFIRINVLYDGNMHICKCVSFGSWVNTCKVNVWCSLRAWNCLSKNGFI